MLYFFPSGLLESSQNNLKKKNSSQVFHYQWKLISSIKNKDKTTEQMPKHHPAINTECNSYP